MTQTAGESGRIVAAAQEAVVRAWLVDCLSGGDLGVEVCAAPEALADCVPGQVEVVVVDDAALEAPGTRDRLGQLHAAGVPIVVVGRTEAWERSRSLLRAVGAEMFDRISPDDPVDLARLRVRAALRAVRAERGAEVLRNEHLEADRNRVVVQLAGAVAHKLKQPLTVAAGYLEMLLDEPGAFDEPTQGYLQEVRDAVYTMDEVVNRLQRATVYQTRQYAGALEILNLDALPEEPVGPGVQRRD